MRIEKIENNNAGTYNSACFYLESRGIFCDEIKTSPNMLRTAFIKNGKKIAEYREDKKILKIYHS